MIIFRQFVSVIYHKSQISRNGNTKCRCLFQVYFAKKHFVNVQLLPIKYRIRRYFCHIMNHIVSHFSICILIRSATYETHKLIGIHDNSFVFFLHLEKHISDSISESFYHLIFFTRSLPSNSTT
jgi:hypothetical protein